MLPLFPPKEIFTKAFTNLLIASILCARFSVSTVSIHSPCMSEDRTLSGIFRRKSWIKYIYAEQSGQFWIPGFSFTMHIVTVYSCKAQDKTRHDTNMFILPSHAHQAVLLRLFHGSTAGWTGSPPVLPLLQSRTDLHSSRGLSPEVLHRSLWNISQLGGLLVFLRGLFNNSVYVLCWKMPEYQANKNKVMFFGYLGA